MQSKKSQKPTKKDKAWQKKIEERTKSEKIELDHPKGKVRFLRVIKHALKKKSN